MLGTVLSLSLSSAREVRTSSLWWLSLGPHHRAHSRTGSSCRTEAGFPIVWCWNIPQDGPESENSWLWAYACFLSQSPGQEPGAHQGTHSIRALLSGGVRTAHSLYIHLSSVTPSLHSPPGFSFRAPLHVCPMVFCWMLLSRLPVLSLLIGESLVSSLDSRFLLVSICLRVVPSSRGQRGMTHFFQVSKWSQD